MQAVDHESSSLVCRTGIFGSLIGKGREILILYSGSYILELNKVIYHEQYECSIIIRGVRKACQQAIS